MQIDPDTGMVVWWLNKETAGSMTPVRLCFGAGEEKVNGLYWKTQKEQNNEPVYTNGYVCLALSDYKKAYEGQEGFYYRRWIIVDALESELNTADDTKILYSSKVLDPNNLLHMGSGNIPFPYEFVTVNGKGTAPYMKAVAPAECHDRVLRFDGSGCPIMAKQDYFHVRGKGKDAVFMSEKGDAVMLWSQQYENWIVYDSSLAYREAEILLGGVPVSGMDAANPFLCRWESWASADPNVNIHQLAMFPGGEFRDDADLYIDGDITPENVKGFYYKTGETMNGYPVYKHQASSIYVFYYKHVSSEGTKYLWGINSNTSISSYMESYFSKDGTEFAGYWYPGKGAGSAYVTVQEVQGNGGGSSGGESGGDSGNGGSSGGVAFSFSGSSNSNVNGDYTQTAETAGQTGQNAAYTNGKVYVWYASGFSCWFCTTVLGDAASGPPIHASNGSGEDPWSVPDGWSGVTCTKAGSGSGEGSGGSSDIPENGFKVTGVTSPASLNGVYSLTSGNISNLSSCQWTNENGGHLKYFSGGYWIFGDTTSPANTPGDCFYYGQGMDKKPWEITYWGDGSYTHSGTLVLTGAGSSSGGGDYTTFTVDGIRSYGELNGTYNRTSGSGKSAVYTIAGGGTCSYHEGLSQWQFISATGSVAIAATADAENPWDVERWWDDNMMNEPTITFSNMA